MRTVFYLYALHGLFWAPFVLRAVGWLPGLVRPARPPVRTAAFSRTLLLVHTLGLGVMYFGMGRAIFGPDGAPDLLPRQRSVGGALILVGFALGTWTMIVFRSWRLRAQINEGHELCTDGPFRLVRHPIYTAIDLLALGSACWIPTPTLAAAFVLVALGGDLRARAEERLLFAVFGDRYADYMAMTRRFLPGVY